MCLAVGISMLAGSLAGITEHAIIFPVDSIKVSRRIGSTIFHIFKSSERLKRVFTDTAVDPHASLFDTTRSYLYRHVAGVLSDIEHRG